ncbi:MAG: VOC family protein [Actinomycetota bacterium]|nr:VOC family protein [Acidimicrobiia bacterium]MDQ3469822.1 VOC family protein [Actinomycetota bacterium]
MTGRVVHFEIPFDDNERGIGFYREVFGWQIMPMPEMDYTIVSTGPTSDQGIPSEPGYIGGGMFKRQDDVASPVVTIDVDDIDNSLATIKEHGGATVRAKEQVGEMGWAAYFTDSEGNLLGLWQNATPS